jgi:hypothetical protein
MSRKVDKKAEEAEELPRINTEKHGIKMRRQKKDWTSAYAKVTKARGEEKKKHRHGLTQKNTELRTRSSRRLATE